MCLARKSKNKDRKKWLKNQPDVITAYKVVQIRENQDGQIKMYPLYYDDWNKPFKRRNRLRVVKNDKTSPKKESTTQKQQSDSSTSPTRSVFYIAYFHLFMSEEKARNWKDDYCSRRVVECTVPKKFITDIGEQSGQVIVTRGFDIVGQDEYID